MEKTHVAWEGGHTLHAIGAVDHHSDVVAAKTWVHTGGGANPIVVMWDAHDGRLLAIIEAFALGQLRTGAMTGLATRWLAPATAPSAALIGTGRQAMAQLGAMSAARSSRGRAGVQPGSDPPRGVRRRSPSRRMAVRSLGGRFRRGGCPRRRHRHDRDPRASTVLALGAPAARHPCQRHRRDHPRAGRDRARASLRGATWSSPTARGPPSGWPPSWTAAARRRCTRSSRPARAASRVSSLCSRRWGSASRTSRSLGSCSSVRRPTVRGAKLAHPQRAEPRLRGTRPRD